MSAVAAILTTEQRDLAEAVADLLAKRSPEAEVRRLMADDAGYDPARLGRTGRDGSAGPGDTPRSTAAPGAGSVELGVVMEQMGAALLCAPYLSTAVLTANLLVALDDTAECAEVLPRIATGDLIATVAFAEPGSARPPEASRTTAQPDGSGWRLSGAKTFVLDALTAQRLYVSRRLRVCSPSSAMRRG